jgi:hypothetical protein
MEINMNKQVFSKVVEVPIYGGAAKENITLEIENGLAKFYQEVHPVDGDKYLVLATVGSHVRSFRNAFSAELALVG